MKRFLISIAMLGLMVVPTLAQTLSHTHAEMPVLKKVGHLTQVGDAKFVDLTQVKTVSGMISVLNARSGKMLPLSEAGVKEASELVKAGLVNESAENGGPNTVVVVSIKLDDLNLSVFSADDRAAIDEKEAVVEGLQKSLTFFAELLQRFQ